MQQSDWSVGDPLFHLETSQFTYRPLPWRGRSIRMIGLPRTKKLHRLNSSLVPRLNIMVIVAILF